MKYSVIIPVYNERTAIRRCLDSVLTQLPENAEVLLIDDGSDDGTVEICREYAAKFHGITFIEKPNGGVSSARNAGLAIAKGEYVLFVDADDAVREDYFKVLDEALKCSPDMLLFRRQLMGRKRQRRISNDREVVYDSIGKSSRFLSRCLRRQGLNLITTKAFRSEIIKNNGLRFDERLDIGEDKAFAFAFSLCAQKVKSITTPLYYLSVDDPDSLSRRKRDHLCESVLLEHRLMAEKLKAASIPEGSKKSYRKALSYSFYRSAYTVVGELRKFDIPKAERINRVGKILDEYSKETGFRPEELYCKAIARPVQKKRAVLIDAVMQFYAKRCSI